MCLSSNYQLRLVKKGKNNYVFGKINIVERKHLSIGSNCSFNHGCYINASNGIQVGDDVTFSAHCCVISTGIDYTSWINGCKKHLHNGKIRIGNHVWVGANAVILPGVEISGKYVIIAANTVVNRSIKEDYCIVAGIPGKIIKKFVHGNE